ncbi:MAG: transposase [Kineosporiaceae bacterium]
MRYWRDEHGTWRRYEPWMSTIVDVDTGGVLGVVDGRGAAGVAAWLAARPQEWRDRVEVVAIDPSAAFRAALRDQLPQAAVSVDAFHLVKPANDTLTRVRQRLARQTKGRRSRDRPGLDQPATPASRWGHPQPSRPGPAPGDVHRRRPRRRSPPRGR